MIRNIIILKQLGKYLMKKLPGTIIDTLKRRPSNSGISLLQSGQKRFKLRKRKIMSKSTGNTPETDTEMAVRIYFTLGRSIFWKEDGTILSINPAS